MLSKVTELSLEFVGNQQALEKGKKSNIAHNKVCYVVKNGVGVSLTYSDNEHPRTVMLRAKKLARLYKRSH